MNPLFTKKINSKIGLLIILSLFIFASLFIWTNFQTYTNQISSFTWKIIKKITQKTSQPPQVSSILQQFSSEEEFKLYLKKGESQISMGRGEGYIEERVAVVAPPLSFKPEGATIPERFSQTNVQVLGIDEPDIVKTDGKKIYLSTEKMWHIWKGVQRVPELKIINALPPENLSLENKIEKSGSLLLVKEKNILVIFGEKEISAFDISNSQKPKELWVIKLDKTNEIVTSRLYKGKIYLVVQSFINKIHPCPIKPLLIQGKELEIRCPDIYHPIVPTPVDVTYIAMKLNPETGEIERKISFVGLSHNSVVYMSENFLYITYEVYPDLLELSFEFLKEREADLFPREIIEKVEKLRIYDISQQTKLIELQNILQEYFNFLNEDEKLRLENETQKRFSDYLKEKIRNVEKTGIVKINLEELGIEASNFVPGRLLNQFALDEYQTNLRVAVTVGERFFWIGFGAQTELMNDVYVLDKNLKIIGTIQNLGLGERIYSARFIQDKGYLVTFRETDPFFVLDLSNPKNPQLKGQLKIPGFSSYLHEIAKDKILGIGKEEWQVKVSFFDVSDPQNPRELDKYILDETWSDVLNTHHAFLLDPKHQIFVLPGSKGAYIFSFSDNKLKLTKAISQFSTKRAIYINDYLYLISDNQITVLDENTWEKIKELEI